MRLTTDLFEYCARADPALEHDLASRATTCARRAARPCRRSASRSPTRSPTCRRAIDAGHGGRRLRPAARLLLQRAQQRVPGGGEVPRRAPDVGADHARALRRREAALADDALPHPDRRRDARRAAAREQHRARGAAGLRRGVRRHPVAAHQRLRRGARAAVGARRAHRAAHPADPRRRVGRDRHRRPVRRLLLRRGADRRDRGARAGADRQGRGDGRVGGVHPVHPRRGGAVGLGLRGALPDQAGHRGGRERVRDRRRSTTSRSSASTPSPSASRSSG